ncbi:hypothetical protein EYF80_002931 [Liparis tanakae]|uniref:Uncharacterized protein n=1 Tax=Liparis tanakae TaxID=230148 RepID=A0A4Z2JAQ4_9TELE|nr:hypothetical protein EYF80_002931 [Liparis tanakae]
MFMGRELGESVEEYTSEHKHSRAGIYSKRISHLIKTPPQLPGGLRHTKRPDSVRSESRQLPQQRASDGQRPASGRVGRQEVRLSMVQWAFTCALSGLFLAQWQRFMASYQQFCFVS